MLLFLFKYRRLSNLLARAIKIFRRYGITKRQLQDYIQKYIDLMHSYNCVPSFPITSQILKRYPTLVKKLVNEGAEFAIHGYIHSDYTKLSSESLIKHFEKAISNFGDLNIPFSGFRYPYLKWNEKALEIMNNFDFSWDSSQAVIWDFFTKDEVSSTKWKTYQKILNQYDAPNAQNCIIRPSLIHNFVEIPVSLPDDDILIDRLGFTNQEIIANIWYKILRTTHEQGDLFTLQLHPERINLCGDALESILRRARNLNPPVWIASLNDIANWWKEKKEFSIEINEQKKKYL